MQNQSFIIDPKPPSMLKVASEPINIGSIGVRVGSMIIQDVIILIVSMIKKIIVEKSKNNPINIISVQYLVFSPVRGEFFICHMHFLKVKSIVKENK